MTKMTTPTEWHPSVQPAWAGFCDARHSCRSASPRLPERTDVRLATPRRCIIPSPLETGASVASGGRRSRPGGLVISVESAGSIRYRASISIDLTRREGPLAGRRRRARENRQHRRTARKYYRRRGGNTPGENGGAVLDCGVWLSMET